MFRVGSDARDRAGCTAKELAIATCNRAFKTTASKDNCMTFDQFLDWYDQAAAEHSSRRRKRWRKRSASDIAQLFVIST